MGNETRTSDELLYPVVRTEAGGWKYTEGAYHRRWLVRVMKQVKVDPAGCWLWQGFKGHTGYAQINYRGKSLNGHRMMWIIHRGIKLVTEQYVLHRCDVRHCLNPDHMWIGTAKDNNNDCARKGRHYEGSRTHCERGHPFAGDNLRLAKQKGGKYIRRVCIACEKLRAKGLV
jgi:hypothetical protein